MDGGAPERAEPPIVELDEIRETSATRFGRPQNFGETVCLPVYVDRLVAGQLVSVLVARLTFARSAYFQAVFGLAEEQPVDVYGCAAVRRRGVN